MNELISQFGKFHSCKLNENGYAYVQFENVSDAQDAIASLNNKEYKG